MNERKSQTKSRVSCVIRVQCPKTPPMHTAQLHNFLHHYKYCVFKMPTLPPPNLLPFTPNSASATASASLIFYVGVLGTLYSGQINIGGPLTFVVVAFSSFLNVFPFEKISLEPLLPTHILLGVGVGVGVVLHISQINLYFLFVVLDIE